MKTTNMNRINIIKLLVILSDKINGCIRTSKSGVPHIVVKHSHVTYSVCYFAKWNKYRVFYPYPDSNQTKKTLNTQNEVIEFFK